MNFENQEDFEIKKILLLLFKKTQSEVSETTKLKQKLIKHIVHTDLV